MECCSVSKYSAVLAKFVLGSLSLGFCYCAVYNGKLNFAWNDIILVAVFVGDVQRFAAFILCCILVDSILAVFKGNGKLILFSISNCSDISAWNDISVAVGKPQTSVFNSMLTCHSLLVNGDVGGVCSIAHNKVRLVVISQICKNQTTVSLFVFGKVINACLCAGALNGAVFFDFKLKLCGDDLIGLAVK